MPLGDGLHPRLSATPMQTLLDLKRQFAETRIAEETGDARQLMQQFRDLAGFVVRALSGFEERLDRGERVGLAAEVPRDQRIASLGRRVLNLSRNREFCAHEAADRVGQIAKPDRFRQMALHAGGDAGLDVRDRRWR